MGCSTYKNASFPNSDPSQGKSIGEKSVIAVGDNVRITLTNSTVLAGQVMEVETESLVIDPSVEDPETEMSPIGIPACSVSNIELKSSHLFKSVMLIIGVVVGVGLFVAAMTLRGYPGGSL